MVTREEVLHVARLAKLELTSEEVERFRAQLGAILDAMNRLRELDDAESAAPEPGARGESERALRADDPRTPLPRDIVIALFPDSDGEHARVPPVLPPRKGS
jgi:aspartyl-tRNA(Asn)/glutamyl-tRNA(Gln) amidotransferase subunit C